MKRYLVILSCLSVLYAGTLWALEGCRNLGLRSDAHHQFATRPASHHHGESAPSHHSQSDSGEIHCLNVFGEFVLSSPISHKPIRSEMAAVPWLGATVPTDFYLQGHFSGLGDGPPGRRWMVSLPQYLVLSVLRI